MKIDTPCFIIRTNKIEELLGKMKSEYNKRWPNGVIGYSFKTNNLPWIINYMKENGLWAETVSSDEYDLALELGFSSEKIIFNGPVKRKETFIKAVKNGSIVNLDSMREVRWLVEMSNEDRNNSRIGLRVNFCIEDYCSGESQCGEDDGRFGFSFEEGELGKVIDILRTSGVEISGIHLHCSSKTRSLNIYKAISEIAIRVVEEYDLVIDYVDIGGGFFGGVSGKPGFGDYFSIIKDILSKSKKTENVNLIIEPGMSLIGASVDYYTSVVDTKKTKNNTFVITDGSRIHIDPLMKKTTYSYQIDSANQNNGDPKVEQGQIICGFTCMEGDRFFKYDGPQLKEDDMVIFEKVGAYTMGLSPQFIEFYPTVYVDDGDSIIKVRSKNTASQFLESNKI